MNNLTNEPQQATSEQSSRWRPSAEELQLILEKHNQWLKYEYNTDLDHLRADLSGADLSRAQLQGAILTGAQLQGAFLPGAQLQEAFLNAAELKGAFLVAAQLRDAYLVGAQLQGAILSQAQLQGATLINAKLEYAYLPGAQLQGAVLNDADFCEASLIGANFERLAINKGGEPGQERSADLTDANFRDADLSNAQLKTVTGLRAEMLAGAVLTNAKLPEDVARFDQLKHVEETSRNASTVFFGLLVASLYSWLTIATTTDVALITGVASSPLPIINTNIALSGFYWVAPLILIAVYFYFHLYLQRLWGDLASLPARFPDGAALDRKAYPWLLNGLVRAHFKKLELAQRPLTRLENFVSILLAWWVVPFTLLFFWLRFLPRHDWLGTSLHVVLIAGAAWFGVYSYRLAVRTLSGGARATEKHGDARKYYRFLRGKGKEEGNQPLRVRMWRTVRRYLPSGMEAACAGVAIVLVLSAGAAISPGDDLLSTIGYQTYADLTDDDVSTKPSGWTGREETAEVEIAQVKGADLEDRDFRHADARGAFLVKAKLAGAKLAGVKLAGANLSGANLTDADLHRVNLSSANLTHANLLRANLSSANLVHANLSGADLHRANLSSANLTHANLSGADLSSANLSDASLRVMVDHRRGMVRRLVANLSGANLSGVDQLTQGQLGGACGDEDTQLPQGLTIRMCPVTAPEHSPSDLVR